MSKFCRLSRSTLVNMAEVKKIYIDYPIFLNKHKVVIDFKTNRHSGNFLWLSSDRDRIMYEFENRENAEKFIDNIHEDINNNNALK